MVVKSAGCIFQEKQTVGGQVAGRASGCLWVLGRRVGSCIGFLGRGGG